MIALWPPGHFTISVHLRKRNRYANGIRADGHGMPVGPDARSWRGESSAPFRTSRHDWVAPGAHSSLGTLATVDVSGRERRRE